MFHFAESGVAALWTDLYDAGLLVVDRAVMESASKLRAHCLNVGYDGPFALGFACYWIFPTFRPDDLRGLFGNCMEPPGFEDTKARLNVLLEAWAPKAVVSFNGKVFENLMVRSTDGYLKCIRNDLLWADYRISHRSYRVFQTYPAAWRYDQHAGQLRLSRRFRRGLAGRAPFG